jgi:ribosome-associated protein
MRAGGGNKKKPRNDIKSIVLETAELLRDRRAKDILVLDMQGYTVITDYFIICTVTSSVQIKALIRYIEEFMDERNLEPLTKKVNSDNPWVLLDYNYFIIHIFLQEGREYYQLEKLWSDAEVLYSHKGGAL